MASDNPTAFFYILVLAFVVLFSFLTLMILDWARSRLQKPENAGQKGLRN